MSELICPKCNAQSPEDAFYCQRCAQPLLCKGCKALLLLNARACIQCGMLIPERTNNEQYHMEVPSVLPGYSRLKIHETPDVRDLDLVVANEAIEHIKDFFPPLAGNRSLGQFKRPLDHQTQQTDLVEVTSEVSSSPPQLPVAKSIHPLSEHTAEQRIWEIFKERDGKLVQEIIDLKATSKKDYIIRLVSLYLYAQESRGEEKVLRKELSKILDEANVKDTNFSVYINKSGIRRENETLRLTSEARSRTQQYISAILDPNEPKGWLPSDPTPSTNGRTKKSAKRGSERHSESDVLVTEWTSCEKTQELNKKFPQSITGKFSVEDKALFGLYCLDKAGVIAEIQPIQLSRYLYSAFQLNVRSDGIRFKNALAKKPPYVARPEGSATYRITASGITHVEQLLQSSK